MVHVVPALWRAHWCRLSRVQDLRSAGVCPLVVCSLLLSSFSLCLWCIVLEYALISRFKGILGGFGRFVWVYVACVLCVACGALYACGVRRIRGLLRVYPYFYRFAAVFLLLCLFFSLFIFLILLLPLCVFVALWVWLLFPFPLRTTRKKKGREGFPLRPLLSCCKLV